MATLAALPVPSYWNCGDEVIGPRWGFGYWTGPQSDLLCVKPDIKTNEEAEKFLSPICNSKDEAKEAFLVGDKGKDYI